MARRYYSSTAARTTITGSVTNSGTSITVAATTGFPSSYPWSAILDQDTASEEVVEVTAAAGAVLTVVRGVDGTTAVSHASGATFNHGVSARDYSEANAFINGGSPMFENTATVSANYSMGTGNNGISAGPVTVASGITVTVPSGSVWVVV